MESIFASRLCKFNVCVYSAPLVCLPTEGLEIIPNGVRVREGDNLVLICRNDDGSYPTGGITWSGPSGTTYGPNPGALGDHVRASYHLLYINNVVPSDHGNYQCRDVATGSQSPAIVVVVTSECVCVRAC